MIKRAFITIVAILCTIVAYAQGLRENVVAMTDRECYLTGERLRVSVDVRLEDGTPSPSKVAYVEVSDTKQMCAQAMVALDNGIGWGEIALAPNLHSGNYQLTVYTRAMRNYGTDAYFKRIIGIVNADRLSRRDAIMFLPKEQYANVSEAQGTIGMLLKEGGELVVNIAKEQLGHCSVSIERVGLLTEHQEPAKSQTEKNSAKGQKFTPELEGHIVTAKAAKTEKGDAILKGDRTRLVLVGQTANVYDGQHQEDGSFCYYTSNVYGTQPSVVNGYDYADNAMPMKLMSPFAMVIPQSLPELTVYCDKKDLVARRNEARRQNEINEWLKVDSLVHSTGFKDSEPDRFYDLDEYTKFSTINEILIEFVKGVKRRKYQGVNNLYTFESETRRYSTWPALVLLDGMPVYDIDEILMYDAHLVKYVQIYNGRYTFGNSCCQGVISFITHKGRLSNYKLDAGSHLVSYAFPQNRPAFVNLTGDESGVIYWNPCVETEQVRVQIPREKGKYRAVLQWRNDDGNVERRDLYFCI